MTIFLFLLLVVIIVSGIWLVKLSFKKNGMSENSKLIHKLDLITRWCVAIALIGNLVFLYLKR